MFYLKYLSTYTAVEFGACMSYHILMFCMDVITYSYPNLDAGLANLREINRPLESLGTRISAGVSYKRPTIHILAGIITERERLHTAKMLYFITRAVSACCFNLHLFFNQPMNTIVFKFEYRSFIIIMKLYNRLYYCKFEYHLFIIIIKLCNRLCHCWYIKCASILLFTGRLFNG